MTIKEKVIQTHKDSTNTGYLNEKGIFILHSFDDEPAIISNDGTKIWCKDNKWHRDNNLPARIYSRGYFDYWKNGKRYWFINNKEYYSYVEVKEKFKNKILDLPNVYILIY